MAQVEKTETAPTPRPTAPAKKTRTHAEQMRDWRAEQKEKKAELQKALEAANVVIESLRTQLAAGSLTEADKKKIAAGEFLAKLFFRLQGHIEPELTDEEVQQIDLVMEAFPNA